MLDLNKIYCMDCLEGLRQLSEDSIDLIVTDPPYGLTNLNAEKLIKNEEIKSKGFMGKGWDNIPPTQVWKECLRVLKPGAFAFIMCVPRQDCQLVMQYRLMKAGFNISFTSVYWTYSSGFPKAQNIGQTIDKQECRKQLTKKLGGKPTKEEFDDAWKTFREVIKKRIRLGDKKPYNRNPKGNETSWETNYKDMGNITTPTTSQAKDLDGSYAGFQPKPAVEIIIVAMKPLSEKTYVAQALKNKKGITWLGNCKIPYANENDKAEAKPQGKATSKIGALAGKTQNDSERNEFVFNQSGRFPANLLVSNDMLNDGKKWKAGGSVTGKEPSQPAKNVYGEYGRVAWQSHGDSGSYSRYFDLDSWFSKQMEELSLDIQNTFPFIAVPKASKSEKDKGLGHLSIKDIPYSGYRKKYDTTKSWVSEYPDGEKRPMNKMRNNHPTVKPLKLMSYLVVLGSREGDVVLDPYIGSGTTGLACKLLNRKYIGFENNADYYKIAQARLSADIKRYRVHIDKKLIKDDEPEDEPPKNDSSTRLDDWI